jgi:hypothetical protein
MQPINGKSGFFIGYEHHADGSRTTRTNEQHEVSPFASSPAIPMPSSHVHRTESEINLTERIAEAEMHDHCMFNRLVHGLKRKQLLQYGVEMHQQEVYNRGEHLDTWNPQGVGVPNEAILGYTERQVCDPLTSQRIQNKRERIINNIISTRQAPIACDEPPCSPVISCNRNRKIAADVEEDSIMIGEIFDFEI